MPPLRIEVSRWCRETRLALDIPLQQLADAVGISRSHLADIEAGRANPTLDIVDRLGHALDTEFKLIGRVPILVGGGPTERDVVHARCSGYAGRRLTGHGLEIVREAALVDGRARGWIDLLAFDRRSGTLLVVEVKTSLDDVGRLERQIGWYERLAPFAAAEVGWDVRRTVAWTLLLATAAADAAIARQGPTLRQAFPVRATAMLAGLRDGDLPRGRGLALIDPRSKRRDWLLLSRSDGRRAPAPYPDVAVARRELLTTAVHRGRHVRS